MRNDDRRDDEMKRTTLSWKLPAPGRLLLGLGLAVSLGCDPAAKPVPVADLTATPQAVTLIQEAKERCVKVAKTGLERVRSAEEGEQRQQDEALTAGSREPARRPAYNLAGDTLESYLKDEAAPELAAVDRAGELIRDLLPEVKKEASPELAQAVQALSSSEEQVCQRVRNAKSSRSSYQESLDYGVHDYDAAEAKLQPLYTVNATDSQFALSKYKPILDQVRASTDRHTDNPMRPLAPEQLRKQRKEWEATQELQQRQQADHDAAVTRWRQREEGKTPILAKVGVAPELAAKESLSPEKRQQTMQTWYARYSGRVAPVHTALSTYKGVLRGPQDQMLPVCRALMDATSALNADAAALDPPDIVAARALKKAYANLQASAQACLNALTAESAFRLADYEASLSQATAALQPYNVTP
jgi:hypothetical protein